MHKDFIGILVRFVTSFFLASLLLSQAQKGLGLHAPHSTTILSSRSDQMAADSWSTFVHTDISTLKGVGPKTTSCLHNLDIRTIGELLLHVPVKITKRDELSSVQQCILNEEIGTFELDIERHSYMEPRGKKPAKLFTRDVASGTPVEITFFTMDIFARLLVWRDLKVKLEAGIHRYWVRGKPVLNEKGTCEIINPLFITEKSEENRNQTFCIDVHYSLTRGLTRSKLRSLINISLENLSLLVNLSGGAEAFEILPKEVLTYRCWPSLTEALFQVHNPLDETCLLEKFPARQRLIFEELVSMYMRMHEERVPKFGAPLETELKVSRNFSISSPNQWSKIYVEDVLPFSLTPSQKTCIGEISSDLISPSKMVRLLQGDVGTGKTVVALSTILEVVETGKISIILAPTEVLATQHYNIINECFLSLKNCTKFEKLGQRVPQVGLLTGSVTKKVRGDIKQRVMDGTCRVLVGTHALLHGEVIEFLNAMKDQNMLGLVVIDEEQKFGVNQREKLAQLTNVLYTTATPIPRSLSLILQDSMSISTIRDKVPTKRRTNTVMLESSLDKKVIDRIITHIQYGTKAFWVTPFLSSNNSSNGKGATERFNQIASLCPGKVGLLHGQLDSFQKHVIVDKFKDGELSVLVTTSIIEVGVDIPDASICIIEEANRFGLSQLHQIRGRVGRGSAPMNEKLKTAQCVLLYNRRKTVSREEREDHSGEFTSLEKLKFLCESNDGFEIAEADLQMRGPGDFFGARQHGISSLRLANLLGDKSLLEAAKDEANRMTFSASVNLNDNDESRIRFVKHGLFGLMEEPDTDSVRGKERGVGESIRKQTYENPR